MRAPGHPFLRAMSAGDAILAGLWAFRDHLRLLVLVSLLPHLALLAVEWLVLSAGATGGGPLLLILGTTVVANGVALAALTVAVARAVQGDEPGIIDVYQHATRSRPGAVVLAYFITAVLVSSGMLLLIVPGLFLGALFVPTVCIVVLERRTALDAIRRSVDLMRPHLLKGMVVFTFFVLTAGFLPLLLLALQDSQAAGPFTPLLSAIVGAVTMPLGYAPHVALYFSIRSEEDGAAAELLAALEPPPAD